MSCTTIVWYYIVPVNPHPGIGSDVLAVTLEKLRVHTEEVFPEIIIVQLFRVLREEKRREEVIREEKRREEKRVHLSLFLALPRPRQMWVEVTS